MTPIQQSMHLLLNSILVCSQLRARKSTHLVPDAAVWHPGAQVLHLFPDSQKFGTTCGSNRRCLQVFDAFV